MQLPVTLVPIPLPPPEQRVAREARFAGEGEARNRYHLPTGLDSTSPVGFRRRLPLTQAEADAAACLLSLAPPAAFAPGVGPTEAELFEEAALGVLSARQSTNYRGQRQVTLGPEDSARLAELLRALPLGAGEAVLDGATYTHVALTRPYRTPFTFLLTFIGHNPWTSPLGVAQRAWAKKFAHADDIPTIGFLQHLHVGIWADAVERAAVLASGGARRANVILRPFADRGRQPAIEALIGLDPAAIAQGWRVAFVAQVGLPVPAASADLPAPAAPAPALSPELCRKIGANLLAFRSERIQPGVNAEEKAPAPYQARQAMDVPDALTEMAGRAAYNAFCRWTGVDRDTAKRLLLMERIDVLTPNGKERLRAVRTHLEEVTDTIVRRLPLWVDLPTGRALSRNAARGKKAFALAGQRIYVGGLSRPEVEAAGLDFAHAVRAVGAVASRSALVCELAGCIDLPPGCDLLSGICLMAGPVNQNDIAKSFYGGRDLLADAFAGRDPTSLLVWTLKAKTVADPIGNEEQLMNARQKGALVDLRAGPDDVVELRIAGRNERMRARDGRRNGERAFADQGNFEAGRGADGSVVDIPGNRGSAWPAAWRAERPWG